MEEKKRLMTGAETVVAAARDAGARFLYGYPITPVSEILTLWIKEAARNQNLSCLQTEDEIAAGFMAVGSVLAGEKSFSATAGPGTILMQDPLVMAEAMRLPLVLVVAQRGGPSSGTVIYSQQEVNAVLFGGNGEGLRMVYSPSDLSELYYCVRRAFVNAWRFRFPAIVLTDGYLMKTLGVVDLDVGEKKLEAGGEAGPAVRFGGNVHLPTIYTFEEELFEKVKTDAGEFEAHFTEMAAFEEINCGDAEEIIIAHGIVAAAAKQAVSELRKEGRSVGLFRPISLNPFPKNELNRAVKSAKKLLVAESSLGQLEKIVRSNLETKIKIESYLRPGLGIETGEIVKAISHKP